MKTTKILFFTLIALAFMACSNDDTHRVGFYLTDAPADQDIEAVYIDVQAVRYNTNGENWTELDVTPTIVNLLDYSNGKDTLLSAIELEAGIKIHQVRLLLGTENSIQFKDGSTVAIKTPSAQESGLKLNVQSYAEVNGSYKVVIDFDASRSIVKQGNGGYLLKPVIRSYITANSSRIYGLISPADVATRIFTTTLQGDTIATVSDTLQNNYFELHGLSTGDYSIMAQDLYTGDIDTLRTNLSVTGGMDVDLGVLTLP